MKLRLRLWVGLVPALLLLWVSIAQSQDYDGLANTAWPMYQGGPTHSGQSPLVGITSSPVVLWKKQPPFWRYGDLGEGMSIGLDGNVYVVSHDILYALNSYSGDVLWRKVSNGSRSTPAVGADGTLYWGFDTSFAALTPSGDVKWELAGLTKNRIFGSSPVIAPDGNIYVSHDGLWSFTSEGEFRWVRPDGWVSHSSPATSSNGTVYVGGSNLRAFSPDGQILWSRPSDNDVDPVVSSSGAIYTVAHTEVFNPYHLETHIYSYRPDGTINWDFQLERYSYVNSFSVAADGTVLFQL